MAETETLKQAIVDAVDLNTGPSVSKSDSNFIAEEAVANLHNDPVAVNAMSQEKWWQSGIAWFGTGGVLWSIGWLFTAVATNGTDFAKYDVNTGIMALGSLAGFGGVLYRRFWPGLKPFFWRWGDA